MTVGTRWALLDPEGVSGNCSLKQRKYNETQTLIAATCGPGAIL